MITLFGAAPDTGNQGVTALCQAIVLGLSKRGLGPLVVADNGRGLRHETWSIDDYNLSLQRVGATHTRRLYRSNSLANIRLCLGAGGLGNPCAEVLKASHAVLDVSGGDSFTDLYGMRRFEAMTLSKRMVLAAGRPLILLPQTLGPFNDSVCRRKAAHILRCASAVWTRDHGSLQLLRDLLGADFDPARHRQGVDLALALPAVAPKTALPECIASWIEQPPEARSRPVFGVNVSGLLYNSIDGGRAQFDLADNYSEAIEAIARALLTSHPSARLLLIPHVLVEDRNPESDWIACRSLQQVLGDTAPGRVEVLPPFYGAAELKSLFTRLDWFCGTRMHATIGAFSEGVPTLALAYSDKTEGVFKACGLAGLVSDLRRSRANALGEVALASFAARAQTSDTLRRILPIVKATAEFQMDDIADSIRALSSSKAAA